VQEVALKPAPRSMAVNESPGQSSFPELNRFAHCFIVNFNMTDMTVQELAALSDDAKMNLTAHVPSNLYLTNYSKKDFKAKMPAVMSASEDVDTVHARMVLSKFFANKADVDSKIPPFVNAKKNLKAAVAKCIRETMQQALLSLVRAAESGKYKSIVSWNQLMNDCGTNPILLVHARDLFQVYVFPKGTHSTEYKRDALALKLMESCGFILNDGTARKYFINLHITEIWSEISQKIKKNTKVSAATSYRIYVS
jgi:hypothetical protein